MKKVLMIGNSASSFIFFRKDLIKFLQSKEMKITILVPRDISGDKKFLEDLREIVTVDLFFLDSKGANPILDICSSISILIHVYKIRPDFTFLYTSKVIAFGGLALRLMRRKYVSFFTGLGYLFNHNNLKAKIGRILILVGAAGSKKIIVLNNDDEKVLSDFFKDKTKILKIPGEGVKIIEQSFEKKINHKPKGLYLGRFISDKGIYELFEALEIIKEKLEIDFTFAGPLDENSPSSIKSSFILDNIKRLGFEYYGFVDEPIKFMKDYDFIILPSYREGLPKSLLEACVAKVPILASDVEGCREVCLNGVNGYLFKSKSVDSIVDAVLRLLKLPYEDRLKMGQMGLDLVKNEFSSDKVNNLVLNMIENDSAR